ncbi:MAG: SCO family protein [Methylophilaceae bacterium]
MKYLFAISLKVVMGLAIILSVWFLVFGEKVIFTENQTALLAPNNKAAHLEKISGLPSPGSYTLQKIFVVPKLNVLDTKGKLQPIEKYATGKITLLTFFYNRCSDANGCPYVMTLFHQVKSKLENDKNLRNSVRLVHISFDPARDTPSMMASLERQSVGQDQNKQHVEWDFLTTASVEALLPVIDGFGQNVDINLNPATGDKTLNYAHVLKAFLMDEKGYVREIYSTNYMSAEMLLNDIQTLALEKTLSK